VQMIATDTCHVCRCSLLCAVFSTCVASRSADRLDPVQPSDQAEGHLSLTSATMTSLEWFDLRKRAQIQLHRAETSQGAPLSSATHSSSCCSLVTSMAHLALPPASTASTYPQNFRSFFLYTVIPLLPLVQCQVVTGTTC
jgi:hypothetical protein